MWESKVGQVDRYGLRPLNRKCCSQLADTVVPSGLRLRPGLGVVSAQSELKFIPVHVILIYATFPSIFALESKFPCLRVYQVPDLKLSFSIHLHIFVPAAYLRSHV